MYEWNRFHRTLHYCHSSFCGWNHLLYYLWKAKLYYGWVFHCNCNRLSKKYTNSIYHILGRNQEIRFLWKCWSHNMGWWSNRWKRPRCVSSLLLKKTRWRLFRAPKSRKFHPRHGYPALCEYFFRTCSCLINWSVSMAGRSLLLYQLRYAYLFCFRNCP